jgi:hypothetical protein
LHAKARQGETVVAAMADNPIPPEPALTAWPAADAVVLAAKVVAVAMAVVAMAAADAEVAVVVVAATVVAVAVAADLSVVNTLPNSNPSCSVLEKQSSQGLIAHLPAPMAMHLVIKRGALRQGVG